MKMEAVSAIWRLRRTAEIDAPSASRLITQLAAIPAAAYEVQPTEEARATACRALRVHELRAADALQLGAGLVWAEHHPTGLGFVCLDRKLREAAEREGYSVLPT
jgi:predicted nucleic acid-binding protein